MKLFLIQLFSRLGHYQGREPAEGQLFAEHDRGSNGVGPVVLRVPASPPTADLQIIFSGTVERKEHWSVCVCVCESSRRQTEGIKLRHIISVRKSFWAKLIWSITQIQLCDREWQWIHSDAYLALFTLLNQRIRRRKQKTMMIMMMVI